MTYENFPAPSAGGVCRQSIHLAIALCLIPLVSQAQVQAPDPIDTVPDVKSTAEIGIPEGVKLTARTDRRDPD